MGGVGNTRFTCNVCLCMYTCTCLSYRVGKDIVLLHLKDI